MLLIQHWFVAIVQQVTYASHFHPLPSCRFPAVPKVPKRYIAERNRRNVLADEEEIDSTQIEIVEVRHG